MTRILTIIALLFATPAWAGEVDGNSFYCSPDGLGTSSHYAFNFQYGMSYGYNDSGRQIFNEYDVTAGLVLWGIDDHAHFRMDRKTLGLFMILNASPAARWQCKFMDIANARALLEQIGKQKDRDARKDNQF
jgi:hypothetical protein